MVSIKNILGLLLAFLPLVELWAVEEEYYEDTYYSSNEGLAFDQVNYVFQDSEGLLW